MQFHVPCRHLIVASACAALTLVGCAGPSKPRTVTNLDLPERTNDPAASRAAFAQAQQAQRAGNFAEAAAKYVEAVRLNDQNVAAWNNAGLLLLQTGRASEGLEALERAAELNQLDARPLVNIAYAYFERGWHARAHEYYLRALERDPSNIEGLRGAFETNRLATDHDALERVKRALLVETDEKWRRKFEFELIRLESAIRDQLLDQANVRH